MKAQFTRSTEELLAILEKTKYTLNKDFFAGYSSERISPGDKKNLPEIKKVVADQIENIAILSISYTKRS